MAKDQTSIIYSRYINIIAMLWHILGTILLEASSSMYLIVRMLLRLPWFVTIGCLDEQGGPKFLSFLATRNPTLLGPLEY